jgi:hypothetical protein
LLPTAANECTSQDQCLEKLDYAIYKTRNIYAQVNLGVGRVQHYFVLAADANGFDVVNDDEATDIRKQWTVHNAGIDAFVVRGINGSLLGRSPVNGSCNKGSKRDGLLAGDATRSFDGLARTFAHEIGHFLGLDHNHDDDDCPNTAAGRDNLMAQTGCANDVPNTNTDIRNATNLTDEQGGEMRGHCSVRNPC